MTNIKEALQVDVDAFDIELARIKRVCDETRQLHWHDPDQKAQFDKNIGDLYEALVSITQALKDMCQVKVQLESVMGEIMGLVMDQINDQMCALYFENP
ncbi:hypothetical protein DIURU_000995 [Diutina rugosa]|uniref:Uncharacterized protein n=1 Tax=Diutina rugosa TaxID=5481 RepID=A0A642UVN3_DIURU|nr:uncharacterized protein DIURU_000995 [Diutina rugosa]KAA8906586.1 hypothetical protein DIURU_000995 [Diutina rugosa]